MIEFLQNFHFLRPWALGFMIFPLMIIFLRIKNYADASSWEEVCDKNLLPYLLVKGSNHKRQNVFLLTIVGIVSAIFAASGPTWKEEEIPAVYKQNPVVIALEMSSEMEDDDITPSRLSRAKYFIEDLLEEIPESQTALIIYTDEPFMVSPLSEDGNIIKNLLPAIDFDIIPINGNRADRTIDFAAEKIANAGFSDGNIILLTSDSGTNTQETLLSAKKATESGYNVNVVEISPQKNDILRQIAKVGGGVYANINDNPAEIISKIKNSGNSEFAESQNKSTAWLDFGYYLLFLPMICCLLMFRRGILLICFCLIISENAYAGFFKTKNQEAAENFKNQEYEQAAETFENTNWQASSLYRAERFDEAYQKFLQDNSETGLYNQGNALAKGGKIGEAIKKYEEVLKINPEHEDAKFNLEYLKQQSGQSSSSQNNEDEKDDEDNSENEQQQNSSEDENNQDENSDNNDNSDEENQGDSPEKNKPENGENNDENQPQPSQPEDNSESSSKENSSQKNSTESADENSDETSSDSQNSKQAPQPLEETDQTPPDRSAFENNEEQDSQTKEKMLAKAQQYRAIEEDPGGLLRALIEQEYMKKRYKD